MVNLKDKMWDTITRDVGDELQLDRRRRQAIDRSIPSWHLQLVIKRQLMTADNEVKKTETIPF